jgi:Spy/CpxP family protein refolding chaperone
MSLRRFGIASCLLVTGVLAGCGADERGAEPVEGSVQAAVSADGRAEHPRGRHGRGGPELLLHAALEEIDLSDAQESSIRAELDALRAKHEQGGRPDGALFAELASQVRAGKVDVTAAMAKAGNPEAAMTARRQEVATALQKLHATLDAEQRRELVAAVQARVADGKQHKGGPDGRRGAGDGAPPAAGERGPRQKGDGHARGRNAGGPAGHLFAELDLDEGQQAALDAALASARPAAPPAGEQRDGKAMREAMSATLQTFTADVFDANAFLTPPAGAPPHGMRGHVEGLVQVVAQLAPRLDAAQREKLAARLEQGPPRKHGAKGGRQGQAPAAK